MLLFKSLPLIVLGVVSLVISLLVLLRASKRPSNAAFSLLAFGVGGWVIGVAAFLLVEDTNEALVIARAYYVFPLLIGTSMLGLAYLFPDKKHLPLPIKTILMFGFAVSALPLILFPNFMTESIIVHSWGKEVVLNHGNYIAYSVFLSTTFIVSLIAFFYKSKQLRGIYKAQAKLLFVGILISAIFGVLFNLVLPGLGNYELIHLGPLATSFFLMAIAYSIIRHRMFNVQLILVRSAAYVLSLGSIVIMYGFASYLISNTAFNSINSTTLENLVNVVLLVVVAITFAPLKKQFDHLTNVFFYRDAYNPETFLAEVNKTVISNVDADTLLSKVGQVIEDHLKTEFTLFELHKTSYVDQRTVGAPHLHIPKETFQQLNDYMNTQSERVITPLNLRASDSAIRNILHRYDIELVAKLNPFVEVNSLGYGLLILGQKKSGNQFSKQDVAVIHIIAGQLSIAVQNALRFEEIERFNVTLQGKVFDATRRLRNTNEKLEAMDETKDEFISMASHQLRTPLTSVKGYVSMVLEGDAGEINDMQRKLLEQAFTSSQRMVYLVADLLNLSRLRTGKFVIEATPTNLSDVIESEVEQLKETARSRSLTLAYKKPKTFPTLMLDETKIRQVIMNFVDNAIYYTPAGGKIEIKLTETGRAIEFTVHDSGIGVPKAEQHHLFNKFYRAHNAQKARPDGTGLGLFMAKKVVVAQGGAIIFKSVEGKGSTFGFTFNTQKLLVPEKK